jgi:hypothetical protein
MLRSFNSATITEKMTDIFGTSDSGVLMRPSWLPIAFFLWIIGGFVVVALMTMLIASACRYAPLQDTQVTEQNWRQKHADTTQKNQHNASRLDQTADSFSIPIDLKRSIQHNSQPNERRSEWQQESWWGKFWCEVKASDAAVAFFTYTLFIAGWFAIRNAARLARELERAYVSGGGPWVDLGPLFPGIRGLRQRSPQVLYCLDLIAACPHRIIRVKQAGDARFYPPLQEDIP